MTNIFICEDFPAHRKMLEECITQCLMKNQYDMNLEHSTANPYDMLTYIKEKKIRQGLYFLDIHLNTNITGIDLAIEIRKLDTRGMIAFVTSNSDYISLTIKHRLEAVGYITKNPFSKMEEEIYQCIDLAQNRLNQNGKKKFTFNREKETIIHPIENILYFEKSSDNRNQVKLISKVGTYEFYGTLTEIIDDYPQFYKIGSTYVVNIDNVKTFLGKKLEITMSNGLSFHIPERHRKTFREYLSSQNMDSKIK